MTHHETLSRRAILRGIATLTTAGASVMAAGQAKADSELAEIIRRHDELAARRDELAAEIETLRAERPPCSPPIGIHEILPVQACWMHPGHFWTEPDMVAYFFDDQIDKVTRFRADSRPEYHAMYDAEAERLAFGRDFGIRELQRRINEHARWLEATGWQTKNDAHKKAEAEAADLVQAVVDHPCRSADDAVRKAAFLAERHTRTASANVARPAPDRLSPFARVA